MPFLAESTSEMLALLERLGSLGILAAIGFYLFKSVLPNLITKHSEELASQRAVFLEDKSQDRLDFLQAIKDQRVDFLAAVRETTILMAKMTISLDDLTKIVTNHDTNMKQAHSQEQQNLIDLFKSSMNRQDRTDEIT